MAARPRKRTSGLLNQEKMVLFFSIIGIVIYFFIQIYFRASRLDLFAGGFGAINSKAFLAKLWIVVSGAWQVGLAPIFITLNVMLVVLFIIAFMGVFPLLRYVKLYPDLSHHYRRFVPVKKRHEMKKDSKILKHWADIVQKANTGTLENMRAAVMEADALVDTFLKQNKYQGTTMAERLKHFSSDDMASLDKLWDAHRIRNDLVHTPGYKLSPSQAQKALRGYRDFLKELDAF